MAPISVCLVFGWSSAYWHMRRRSSSVNVFLGWDGAWMAGNLVVFTGAVTDGMATGGAECDA